jgi:hypothetical protein
MSNNTIWKRWGPTIVVLLAAALMAVVTVYSAGGDPLALARLGTRFSQGDPQGSEGYDGQFVYYIARDPSPQQVVAFLDVPAYRYQRILLPLLARAFSLGQETALPWAIVILGILSLAGGTWAISELFADWGVSRWYALIYGFWAGFTLALLVDLPEPLAYGLVAGGLLAIERRSEVLGWFLLGLATFARETTALFVAAVLLSYLAQRRWRSALGLALVAVLPFALFQLWLWRTFGQAGIGSGGAMATPFEWIPFMGLLRIGSYSLAYLLAMLVVFGPTVILPSLWGIWKSTVYWLAGEKNWIAASLLLNALVILFTPFSTFRETGGIIRFATGLMLAVLLFAGHYRQRRVLNYCIFWAVLNVFLLKS